jgi:hypothetical protein
MTDYPSGLYKYPRPPWAWDASLRRSSSSGQDKRRRGYIRDRIATS